MKNIAFILFALLFFPYQSYSQKAKGKIISYKHMQLPSDPLEGEFKTYSVRVKDTYSTLLKMGLTDNKLATQYFDFKQYKRQGQKGDFELYIEVGEPTIVEEEIIKTQKTVGKDEAKKTVNYYHYEVKYFVPMVYQLKDGNRELMREEVYNTQKIYKTQTDKSKLNVSKLWIKNRKSTMNKNYAEYIKTNLADMSKKFYNKIDRRPGTMSLNFFRIKKAEKYKAEQYTEAFDLTKKVLGAAKPTTPVQTLKKNMQPAVDIWLAGLEKYDPKSKKERGMYLASAVNLGKTHILFGEFDEARNYIEKAKEADKKAGVIRGLEAMLAKHIQLKEVNENIPNNYKGTYAGGEVAMKEELSLGTDLLNDYIITTTNDTIRGEIDVERTAFGVNKLTVTNNFDTDQPVRSFTPKKIKKIKKGDASYHLLQLRESDKLNGATLELAEIVYVTDKAGVYRKRSKERDEYELYLMKHVEGAKSVNLSGIKFLIFNKGVAKYFSDCESIVAKAKDKKYKRSNESLMQLIDEYTECK